MSRLLLCLLLVTACGGKEKPKTARSSAPPAAARAVPKAGAVYRVIVKSTWTKGTHPYQYPTGDARFSGLIGASHNAHYSIFALGRRPTPGLERLAEEGKHSPLNDEIRAAIDAGNALELFETGSLKNFKDSMMTTVHVDPTHHLISVVNMIQPSPDWFTGASSVDVLENGNWVASRTLRLIAYDAGGDNGTTYKAPDRDANPKKAVSRAMTRHFVRNGNPVPVATLKLIREP